MEKKLCLITEIPSHYRKLIYQKLEEEMECDFYVGSNVGNIKRIKKTELKNMTELKVKYLGESYCFILKGIMKNISQYDVIINDLGIFSFSSWLILFKAKFTKQKVYHWDHGWYGREGFIKKIIKRLYFGLATGAFIYGDRAIKLMKENGFNCDKLFPIHNSLDYDAQIKIRNQIVKSTIFFNHFGNSCPVLIMIGRLNFRKKLSMLIEAVSLLKKNGETMNVVFVGDGEDRKALEKLVELKEIKEQVWFYGACYDENQNAELIYNSDMCVVPGDIGLTAIHCLMFGTPCITHNYFPNQGPEFEAIHEGLTGSFYENGSIDSLACCISRWFKENIDKREKIRKMCYKEIDENWNPYYQMKIFKKVII